MEKIIYYNGTIVCADTNNSIHEAMLVQDGLIKALGTSGNILEKKQEATLVDLEGKTMLPGFIDPHGHIVAVSQSLMMPNFSDVTSIEEMISVLKKALQEKTFKENDWLLGLGYDNSKFTAGKHPSKYDLDQVSKEIPIFVTHASGHVACTNSKALELLGYVGDDYEVPEGGIVEKLEGTNEPSGVLEETAFLAPEKKKCIGAPSIDAVLKSLVEAQDLYASYGITTCQDASVDAGVDYILKSASSQNLLKIDVVGYGTQPHTTELMGDTNTFTASYNNHYKLLGAKMWLDGSPQAKTAWLSEPYYEVPEGEPEDYRGHEIQSDEVVTDYITSCLQHDYQVNAHCNGDAASDQFIRCYKEALQATGNKKDLRPVMVHAQTVREDQLDEMKEIGMLATFFLDHIWYWGDYHYESVLGPDRAQHISPTRSALKRGINFTLHQDPPVVMPIMTLAIHDAVNRKTQSGRVLGEDEKISVIDAIKAVTLNGAYQYFEEKTKGSLEVGKVADMVILDRNPLEISPEQLKDITVLETIKGGKSIYSKITHSCIPII